MRIKDIEVKEITDFRGKPTIEVFLTGEDGDTASAQIPSGKSRGKNEADVLEPAEAKQIAEKKIKPEILRRNFESIGELDAFLVTLDGTPRKEVLGGNLILGISVSFARLVAKSKKKELWEVLNEEFFGGEVFGKNPLIFSNLINGGTHAKNNLDIQEYMVVAKTHDSFGRSIAELKDFYEKLGGKIKEEFGLRKLVLGDEGGYSLDFPDNAGPLRVLGEAIEKGKLAPDFSLAIDAAASGFFENGRYRFDGRNLSTNEMAEVYEFYLKSFPLLMSIEDPFAETDEEGFKKLTSRSAGALVVGDDLTTTNPIAIEKAVREELISGLIVKPNQIGTVTETCEAMKIARLNGVKTIVSHRSGEVEDAFIIHFAKAGGAYGVKIGAPVESRTSKYNELKRIYDR
ncbi:MAG: phosphopyruvate hydratase [Patescibacteria group bacterium]